MAGGTWDSQNKVLPGFYLNFKSTHKLLATVGERGVVAIAKSMSWGEDNAFTTISDVEEIYTKLGYDISSEQIRFLREILLGSDRTNGASKVLVYRLPTMNSAKAKATIGDLTITAKYIGARGNDITIIVSPDLNTKLTTGEYAVFEVTTVVDGMAQDEQTIGSYTSTAVNTPAVIGDLVSNEWVDFSGDSNAALTSTVGVPLEGGVDGTLTATGYSLFLTALEEKTFNVVIYDGEDSVTKGAITSFVERISYDTGKYCQAVMSNYIVADNETVISVKNGLLLNDGTTLTPEQATWWVGGATAGAKNNQSLTYATHPNAQHAVPSYSNLKLKESLNEGSFTFFEEFGQVKVLSDINTFTSFIPDKQRPFSKNRVIRVLFSIANDIYEVYSKYYIGQVNNTVDGRNLFKKELVGYINQLQGNGAVQNFSVDDVEILPGTEKDAILVNLAIETVDSVEKIYMTAEVS